MVAKYYAVVCGVVPGIYTDWGSTQKMVNNYPGAIFKSFHTRIEAEAFISQSTAVINQLDISDPPHVLPLIDKTIIYTDGSFKDSFSGYGVVIISSTGEKFTAYGRVPLVFGASNNISELYAVYVALSLVNGDAILYTDSTYVIGCLTTYIHGWITNGWKGVANKDIIEGAYNKMLGRNITLQYVPAHSGVQLNEEVDQLAKRGSEQLEELILLKDNVLMSV